MGFPSVPTHPCFGSLLWAGRAFPQKPNLRPWVLHSRDRANMGCWYPASASLPWKSLPGRGSSPSACSSSEHWGGQAGSEWPSFQPLEPEERLLDSDFYFCSSGLTIPPLSSSPFTLACPTPPSLRRAPALHSEKVPNPRGARAANKERN